MNKKKRVSLNDRRAIDSKGIDAIIKPTISDNEDITPPAGESFKLKKITLYIRPDQVTTIEEIQLSERKRTGQKPDKSDLIQEAIDLLVEKYTK